MIFDEADLSGAIFKNAVLSGSSFDKANLKDTDFSDSYLGAFDLKFLCSNPTLSGTNPVRYNAYQTLTFAFADCPCLSLDYSSGQSGKCRMSLRPQEHS